MRIAHCIHGLGLGGAQKVIASIVRGRKEGEFDYFVYSGEDGVLRKEAEEAGAVVRVLERHLPKFDPLWAWRLARAMRVDSVDLVHTHLFGDSLHGYLAARLAGGLPVLMTLHIGVEGLNRLQSPGYRWLLSRCQRAVACSASVYQSFREADPRTVVRMVTIPNGIEVPPSASADDASRRELRRSLGVGPDDTIVATIGRLAEQKGLDVLIAAFAKLPSHSDTELRLVLLGEGPLRRELERLAARHGVSDRVIFAGFRSDVRLLLQVLDAVVFSSRYEGLPVALLEAMAASRCIVATDIPGMLDALRADREAIIVPVGEIEPLSEALARITTDRQLRERLGRQARQRFLERFTAERMVGSYEQLYREVRAVTAG